jgi:hypothetical protein
MSVGGTSAQDLVLRHHCNALLRCNPLHAAPHHVLCRQCSCQLPVEACTEQLSHLLQLLGHLRKLRVHVRKAVQRTIDACRKEAAPAQ